MKNLLLLSLLFLLAACGGSDTTDSTAQDGPDRAQEPPAVDLAHEVVFDNEDVLWGFDFLPDGSMLVTEKSGTLFHVVDGEGVEIAGLPQVRDAGQGGLMDVHLHPNYSENGWLYLSYSSVEGEGPGGNTAIARARLKDNGLTDFEVVYKASPNTGSRAHWGSRIRWGGDGKLYFCIGDRFSRDVNPQDLSRDGGKVYRINDDGSIPEDNPFVDTEGARPAIYSYGHRNPQGMAVHPETGQVWTHEHGPRGGDEINIIRPGVNYGWPVITYGINYNGTTITEETEREGMAQPLHYWVPSIAPSGMAFITSDRYPGWEGDLLVGSLKFAYLDHVVMDGEKVVREEKLLNGLGRLRDVRMGPDGLIYASVVGTGIVRVLPPQ